MRGHMVRESGAIDVMTGLKLEKIKEHYAALNMVRSSGQI